MDHKMLPTGNVTIKTPEEFGALIREVRKSQGLTQLDVAGLGGTGNRLIIDIERGKPTVQLQKVLDVLALLGLELTISPKGG